MRPDTESAVVLGGSIAGLLAARVLADKLEQVTVVERDVLPDGPENRRGVPQGKQIHVLLASGAKVLEELFPGLLQDLVDDGVPVVTDLGELHFCAGGHLLSQEAEPIEPLYQATRARLEGEVRSRVRALPNVRVLQDCDVVGLTATADRSRVTGVRVRRRDGDGAEEALPADLVVDATGRSGRASSWLEELGFTAPREEKVDVGVRYVTQRMRLPPGSVPEKAVLVGAVPGRPTAVALQAVEGATWLFVVMGYRGHHPPDDLEGRLQLIDGVAPPHVTAALREAEPVSEPAAHAFPASRRRHFEDLKRFPAGLVVMGDAVCSFNPVYGQGMSIAALEALALRAALSAGEDEDLARRFFTAAAKPVDVAWTQAVGGDLTLPEVPGRRPPSQRAIGWYIDRFQAAAEHDPDLARTFLHVSGLVEPPQALFRPRRVARVLAAARR